MAMNNILPAVLTHDSKQNIIVKISVTIVSLMLLLTVTSVNADMVFDFQKKMADKGNTEAQFKVGEMYETGRGVKKDAGAAVEWFRKAAANGHQEAGYKLLMIDIKKEGMTAKNKSAAKELTGKAKSGDGVSQYYLGKMYHTGVGLKKNSNKALEWYKKAAQQGVTSAEAGIIEIQNAKSNWAAKEAKRKAAEKKRKELAAKKKAKQDAAKAKAQAERKAKVEAAQAARKEAQAKKAAEKKAKLQAERERKRQELIKARQQRAAAEASKKSQAKQEEKPEFEADPCSGKSARFLSTCR